MLAQAAFLVKGACGDPNVSETENWEFMLWMQRNGLGKQVQWEKFWGLTNKS